MIVVDASFVLKLFLINKSDKYYVAECLDIAVVTQGRTLDETIANLSEAVALHLEGEDLADFGLVPRPRPSRSRRN